MAKYVRSKRRTIGGTHHHHHKGKAKKGKGKSKGKKKKCSTVKKCRAEIKKLETRIRKIKSHKKKPKTRRRVRMRTPKELESMYMEGESGKGATGKRRRKEASMPLAGQTTRGISFGFGVALKTLVHLLTIIKDTLENNGLLPDHMKGPFPPMDYKEGNMVTIIDELDQALKQIAAEGVGMAVSMAVRAAASSVVTGGQMLGTRIQTFFGDTAMTAFKSMLESAKIVVGKYPVEGLPQGDNNSILMQYEALFTEKVNEFDRQISEINKQIEYYENSGLRRAEEAVSGLNKRRRVLTSELEEYKNRARGVQPDPTNEESSSEDPFKENLEELSVVSEGSDETSQVAAEFAQSLNKELKDSGVV